MNGSLPQISAVCRKELRIYFGSPLALIFVGVFLSISLFLFFWAETFFTRNIADVRPLFRWMPPLMIFLVSTLTMRQWSDEQRSGTLEVLMTLPVRKPYLAIGKLVAVMILIGVALSLTLFIPITVDILGDLDWGPVIGGYLGSLLMASSYVAIGLFVSSRTDNQIVSLILTVIICGILYLVGTQSITVFTGGGTTAEILRGIGIGSRFESIERGVIDIRDLVYYCSVTGIFLAINIFSLEIKRWSRNSEGGSGRINDALAVFLICINILVLNIWLFPLAGLRIDLTQQREYSLTDPTREVISSLDEQLLIRGYISDRTHPLLEPLVPTVRDFLREYEIGGRGKITAEVLDPRLNEELEAEANRAYGIRAIPFAVSGRHDSSVINSYFDILVRYGDQFTVLNFADLIEIEEIGTGDVKVKLRNLEYDLTSSIKKMISGFKRKGAIFSTIQDSISLTLYLTKNTLPKSLNGSEDIFWKIANELVVESEGKLAIQLVDIDSDNSPLSREDVTEKFGISPNPVSIASKETYFFHLVFRKGDQDFIIYPGVEVTEIGLRESVDSAIRRAVPGLLKTVALWIPPDDPVPGPYGEVPPISSWNFLGQRLSQNYTVNLVDLSNGQPPAADVLVVVAPNDMTDKDRFAVDQFLMLGGAVVVAGGNNIISPLQLTAGISLEPVENGLKEMLEFYGVLVEDGIVLDPMHEDFPTQVPRKVAGMTIVDFQRVPYPPFIDVRRNGMDIDNPITASMPAVTLQWTSPLIVDEKKNEEREVSIFLRSSKDSWLKQTLDVDPDTNKYPNLGFPIEGEQKSYPLAVSIRGEFGSFFKDKPLTFFEDEKARSLGLIRRAPGLLNRSPESGRLVVFGSAEFVNDIALRLSQSISSDRYLFNLQFLENAVDWAVEDDDLLALRSRGTYSRLLKPLDDKEQNIWEAANYGIALIALLLVGLLWNAKNRGERPFELSEIDRT